MENTSKIENGSLFITRYLNATREKVWQAITEPENIKKWWGPKHFTAPLIQSDFRVGGKFLFCMHGTPGAGQPEIDMYDTGVFEEIVPMEKLVYTDSFADKDGNPVSPAAYGMPDMPDVMRVTIELEDAEGGKTKFSLRHDGAPAGQNGTNMQAGWGETLDKLEASLA